MGVARTKLHPVTHTHMISYSHTVSWKSHSKFYCGWSFHSFEQPKQLPVAVAMARPHPYLVNNAFLYASRPNAKIFPDWSLINFFKAKKKFPVGVAMTKLHPLPCPGAFNNEESIYRISAFLVQVFSRDA